MLNSPYYLGISTAEVIRVVHFQSPLAKIKAIFFMLRLNALWAITLQMSSYPSEAEVYRYVVCFNRALIQEYARLSLSATAAVQRDISGSDDFSTTELPSNERGVGETEGREIEMIPISLNVWWGKLKESSFEVDMLHQAVAQGYELFLGC